MFGILLLNFTVRLYQTHARNQCNKMLFSVSSLTCQAVRQEVHIRCLHGSIFTSLSFSAQILQSWKVEPISQYSSYCSYRRGGERGDRLALFKICLIFCVICIFVQFMCIFCSVPVSLRHKDKVDWFADVKQTRPNLSDFDVVLWGRFTQPCQVWILCTTIWEQIAREERHTHKQKNINYSR